MENVFSRACRGGWAVSVGRNAFPTPARRRAKWDTLKRALLGWCWVFPPPELSSKAQGLQFPTLGQAESGNSIGKWKHLLLHHRGKREQGNREGERSRGKVTLGQKGHRERGGREIRNPAGIAAATAGLSGTRMGRESGAPAGTPGERCSRHRCGLSTMPRQMLKQLLKRSIRNVLWEGEKLSFKPPKQRPAVSVPEPSPAPGAAPVPRCAAWVGWLSSPRASTPKAGCFWEFLHIPSIENRSQC